MSKHPWPPPHPPPERLNCKLFRCLDQAQRVVQKENGVTQQPTTFLSGLDERSDHKNPTRGPRPPAPAPWGPGSGWVLARECPCAWRPKLAAEARRPVFGFRGPGPRAPAVPASTRRPLPGALRRGGGWSGWERRRQVPENELRAESGRGSGKRAPSACCCGAAGAPGGGVLLVTWTLLTCGRSRPESWSGST